MTPQFELQAGPTLKFNAFCQTKLEFFIIWTMNQTGYGPNPIWMSMNGPIR